MDKRLELHEMLCEMLGSRNVYFQPPESIKLTYPAIVYSRKNFENRHADNTVYRQYISYEIIVIDPNPESECVQKIAMLPLCTFDRHYKADNLNHDVFTLYNI